MTVDFLDRRCAIAPGTGTFRYPAGEPGVTFDSSEPLGEIAYVRGAAADDLVTLAIWANSVRRLGGRPVALMPYLPGARADHDEHPAGFDAEVYARLINSVNLDRVICVDPHSDVMPGLLDNIEIVTAAELIEPFLSRAGILERLVGLIAPDEGARGRVAIVAERLGLPVYQAYKHRDFATGKLSGFSCDALPETGELLVVDDICDGGGTFMGLASAIPEATDRLHLWVSHGVFSGHAARLGEHYRTIWTTDSHPGHLNLFDARTVPLLPTLLQHLTNGAPT